MGLNVVSSIDSNIICYKMMWFFSDPFSLGGHGRACSQFHKNFRSSFCANKLQSQVVTREKLSKALSYKKVSSKMLMKSRPG